MKTALDHFKAVANRVEEIAGRLTEIHRSKFDSVNATRVIEAEFSQYEYNGRLPEGIQQVVADRIATDRKGFENGLRDETINLIVELNGLEPTLKAHYERVRPHRDVSSPESIALSRELWERVVLLRESGRDLREIAAISDLDTLLSIETFAPAYEHSRIAKRQGADEAEAARNSADYVKRLVDARMTEVAPAAVAETISSHRRAAGFVEIAYTLAEALQRRFEGSAAGVDPIGASVAVGMIRLEYGIDRSARERREEANRRASNETEPTGRRAATNWVARAGVTA